MKKTRQSGITLVALVVTIVVLLILAAVSIATLTGDNGILTQVKKAKSEWKGARKEEEDRLSLYEDKIEDSISEGIWRISLSTNELSTTVKIKVRSEFYSVIPDTLKEYKEWYILKGMSNVDPECKSLDEYCTSALGVSSMEEVIKYFEEQTGNTYTRDEIIYDQLLHSENEDEALKTMGYSTEDIEKIESELRNKIERLELILKEKEEEIEKLNNDNNLLYSQYLLSEKNFEEYKNNRKSYDAELQRKYEEIQRKFIDTESEKNQIQKEIDIMNVKMKNIEASYNSKSKENEALKIKVNELVKNSII